MNNAAIAPAIPAGTRVAWEEDHGPNGLFSLLADWDGEKWYFWERDSWEIRWYALSARPGLVGRAQRLALRFVRAALTRDEKQILDTAPTPSILPAPRARRAIARRGGSQVLEWTTPHPNLGAAGRRTAIAL